MSDRLQTRLVFAAVLLLLILLILSSALTLVHQLHPPRAPRPVVYYCAGQPIHCEERFDIESKVES